MSETASGDFDFEADLQRQPHNYKYWWRYLEFKRSAPAKVRNLLYERALKYIPGSYKLWHAYLEERMRQVSDRCLDDPTWEAVNNTFERSLVFMNKMPRIWVDYASFLLKQCKVTSSRHALDRALRSLPITQHERIWRVYLQFINQDFVPTATAVRCWKRYLQLKPQVEDFVEYLIQKEQWLEVINALIRILNDPDWVSAKGRTRHDLWVQLCGLLAKQEVDHRFDGNLRTETIIRSGISKFPAEVGQLWCALADFNIRLQRFEVARDVFEEGIASVVTVKDFTQIFDTYTQFEESLLSAKIVALEEEADEEDTGTDADPDPACRALLEVCDVVFTKTEDINMRMDRLGHLLERRPELLNSVLLRQNPHNVHEWMNRVKIFADDPQRVVVVYTEAISTVDPAKAVGKPHLLWVNFAKFYEAQHAEGVTSTESSVDPLQLARFLFEKAVKVNFKGVDDLATVWCEYAEFEIRQRRAEVAHKLLKRATAVNFVGLPDWKHDATLTVQERVWKSVKLWSFYLDVEASLGTVDSTKAVYEKVIDLKVATPMLILQYAEYLRDHKRWEDSFHAYERGISVFGYPQVRDLWLQYLMSFVRRYKGSKMERLRDLFEEAVKGVPQEFALKLYMLFAKAEEEYGMSKAAMLVYERAVKAVRPADRAAVYRRYLKRATEYFGAPATRKIYEAAIAELPEEDVPEFCVKYAEVELKLGEVDRVRALYRHCSHYVEPNDAAHVHKDLWTTWNNFEVTYGNQESFREMLRIKRSVQATYDYSRGVTHTAMLNQTPDDAEETRAATPEPPAPASGLTASDLPAQDGEEAPITLEQIAVPAGVIGSLGEPLAKRTKM